MTEKELQRWREAFRELDCDPSPPDCTGEKLAELLISEHRKEEDAATLEQWLHDPEAVSRMKTAIRLKQEMDSQLNPVQKRVLPIWIPLIAAVFLIGLGVSLFILPGARIEGLQTFHDSGITRDNTNAPLTVQPGPNSLVVNAPQRLSIELESMEFSTNETLYQFSLMDSKGLVLWSSQAALQPQVEVPEQIREAMEPGAYLWFVQIQVEEGSTRFGPFQFSIQKGHTNKQLLE